MRTFKPTKSKYGVYSSNCQAFVCLLVGQLDPTFKEWQHVHNKTSNELKRKVKKEALKFTAAIAALGGIRSLNEVGEESKARKGMLQTQEPGILHFDKRRIQRLAARAIEETRE